MFGSNSRYQPTNFTLPAFPSMKRTILDVVLTKSSWYFNIYLLQDKFLQWFNGTIEVVHKAVFSS